MNKKILSNIKNYVKLLYRQPKGVYNEMKKLKVMYIIFLLFPLINLLTGLMTRYGDFPLTIGVIVRIALLVFLVMYVFFLSKSKYKKLTIIYFSILAVFAITYILTKPEYFTLRALYNEANLMFKFMYFPILILGMLNLCDEYGFDTKKWQKIFLIGLIFYIIFILLPVILQSSFNSYVREKYGLVGWFYAANEVGPILLMLYPATFSLLEKHKIWFLIISFISILTILAIATKVATIGLGMVIIIYAILYILFKRKKVINKAFLLIIILIYSILYSPFGDKLYANIEEYNSKNEKQPIVETVPPNTTIQPNPQQPPKPEESFLSQLLSNRDIKVKEMNKEYMEANVVDKLFGIGFYDAEKQEIKIAEMDFFDIFYHYGLIGFLILCFPYLFLLYSLIKSVKSKSYKWNLNLSYAILIFLLILGIGFFAGHIISAPAVSSFLTIYYLYIFFSLKPKITLENK